MGYKLKYTRLSEKDARLLEQAGLEKSAIRLLVILKNNPYQTPPPFERLQGDLKGLYSRRINRRHRLVYNILPNEEGLKNENGDLYEGIVKIIRMWTHYD
jgi:Txe/YoeB family toxin of toxin-antitoxin system